MSTARPLPALLLIAVAASVALVPGCSETEVVERHVVVEKTDHDTSDHVEKAGEDDPYDGIVAGIAARGSKGAAEAWAKERPTLLLFAASW